MINLIRYDEKEKWNSEIQNFLKRDIYYTSEYAESFMKNEDGTPYLLCFHGARCKLCYPIMEKDVANFPSFKGVLPSGKYFDWNTPYGYGGPLSDVSALDVDDQNMFIEELRDLAMERNVVSQFVRFHPLLQNHLICSSIESTYVKDTIYINLDTDDDLMVQMDSKNRNLIRKALKSGIEIRHDKGQYIDDFMSIYKDTMDRDHARQYYYFPKSYYDYMYNNMQNETEYFYAFKDGKIIAASLFFYYNEFMHYHLSCNLAEYRTFAPTNLILYTAANWGRSIGLKSLHLGGGVGVEDSLFHFKKQFNKDGRIEFWMGRNVFLPTVYEELLQKRKQLDVNFDMNNPYYIQYRQP